MYIYIITLDGGQKIQIDSDGNILAGKRIYELLNLKK